MHAATPAPPEHTGRAPAPILIRDLLASLGNMCFKHYALESSPEIIPIRTGSPGERFRSGVRPAWGRVVQMPAPSSHHAPPLHPWSLLVYGSAWLTIEGPDPPGGAHAAQRQVVERKDPSARSKHAQRVADTQTKTPRQANPERRLKLCIEDETPKVDFSPRLEFAKLQTVVFGSLSR